MQRQSFEAAGPTVSLDLDGSGKAEVSSGSGFLDHMLTALARTGQLDLTAQGRAGLL